MPGSPSPSPLIQIQDLSKAYDERSDYRFGPLTTTFAAGETVAILGKNGAGKSTFFQLLSGNLDASAGKVYIKDERLTPDAVAVKRGLGYLPQHLALPRWVSGFDMLRYAAVLYGLPDDKASLEKTLAYWDCDGFRHRPLGACSHGMQKRIGLALAHLHHPDFLILDEPFSGLDIYHLKALEMAIQERRQRGQATLISTHVAPYAAKFCQRALMISAGRVEDMTAWRTASEPERVLMMENAFFPETSAC